MAGGKGVSRDAGRSIPWLFAAGLALAHPAFSQPVVPELRLGKLALSVEDDGSPERGFGPVVGAFLLQNQEVAIVAVSPPRVLVFDATGQLVRSAGGAGAGPGEFGTIAWVGSDGDSLRFYDPILRRFTACARHGCAQLVTAPRVAIRSDREFSVIAQNAHNAFLVRSSQGAPDADRNGLFASREQVGVLSLETGRVEWIAEVRGPTWISAGYEGRGTGRVGLAAFTSSGTAVSVEDELWLLRGDSDSVQILASPARDGSRRTASLGFPARPVSADAVRWWLTYDLSRFRRDDAPFIRLRYAPTNLPEHLPPWDEWFKAGTGIVWIRRDEFAPVSRTTYWGFGPGVRRQHALHLPLGHRLLDLDRDRVAVLRRSGDGVNALEVWTVSR